MAPRPSRGPRREASSAERALHVRELHVTDAERLSVYNHVARHIKEDFGADVLPFADLGKLSQPDRLAALHVTAADVAGWFRSMKSRRSSVPWDR